MLLSSSRLSLISFIFFIRLFFSSPGLLFGWLVLLVLFLSLDRVVWPCLLLFVDIAGGFYWFSLDSTDVSLVPDPLVCNGERRVSGRRVVVICRIDSSGLLVNLF